MTSSISFYKLLKEDIKKRVWLLCIFAGIFLVVLPIATAMQIDSILYWSSDDMNYAKSWFLETELGNEWVGFFMIAGAVLGAVTSFTHLHSRRQLDFYHSLPVKREEWLAVSYISSFIQIIIPCILSYVIRYLIGVTKGVTGQKSAEALATMIGITLLSYHLVYIVSSIGMIITGKMLTGILMIGVLQIWYPFAAALKNMVMGTAFETYFSTEAVVGYQSFIYNLNSEMSEKSPVFLYYRMIQLYFRDGNLGKITFFAIVTGIVLTLITFVLYKRMPSEAAGKAIAFPILESIVKILLAISAGTFFAVMASSQYEVKDQVPIWTFAVGLLSAAFVCCLVEFIYSADMKMLLKKKASFGLAVLGTALVCMILRFDLIGYDTYLPPKEKVVAMSVDLLYENPQVFSNTLSYTDEDVKNRLDGFRTKEFARLYQVAQNGVEHVGDDIDEWGSEKYIPVKVAYYLKSGSVTYRKYYVDYEKMYQCMDSLFADREYRRKYFDVDKIGKDQYYFGTVDMYFGTHHTFTSEQKDLDKLLDTYLEELETKPLSVFENANLVAQLQFTKGDDFMNFPVYKEFTKTLEFLQKEFTNWRNLTVDDVSSMTVEYHASNEENSEIISKVIPKEDMQQVLDSMCYVQTGFLGNIAEKDMYVTIETTMGQPYNYYIRKGHVPECLKTNNQ